MKVRVLYFAKLAEVTGKDSEWVNTHSRTVRELYLEMSTHYTFPLSAERLQFAVNHEMREAGFKFKEGDQIAFLPPMTGG